MTVNRDDRGRSVLVIRTPKTCGECNIMYEDWISGEYGKGCSNCFCPVHDEGDGQYAYAQVSRFTRPSWCPLIDLDWKLRPVLYDYLNNMEKEQ